MNPRPLGYEHCDARLWHLGRSLVTSLASGNPVQYLAPDPLSLRCLALSRRVRFTNRFTETVLDVRPAVGGLCLPTRTVSSFRTAAARCSRRSGGKPDPWRSVRVVQAGQSHRTGQPGSGAGRSGCCTLVLHCFLAFRVGDAHGPSHRSVEIYGRARYLNAA